MRKGFSLIELIFMIVIIGIIASIAVPKLMDTRNSAIVSTLKQDIGTVTTSVQSYYMQHGKIDKISDAVNLNSSTWIILDKEIKYMGDSDVCVSIKLDNNSLIVTINENASAICKELKDSGMSTINHSLK